MILRHLLALLILSPSVGFAQSGGEPPNILWIITDDQRPDSLACYNRAVTGREESPLGFVSSPEIDKLAQEGVLFTRAYCNSPACAPSRGSMITGRYPFRSGIYGFEQTHNAVSTFKPVVPEVMRDTGYSTAVFGKTGYYIFKWGPGVTWNNIGFWDFEVDAKNSLQKNGLTDYFRDKRYAKIDGKSQPVGNEERWFYPDGSVKAYLSGDETSADGGKRKKHSEAPAPAEIPASEKQLKTAIEREQEILYSSPDGGHIIGGESTQTPDKTLDGWTVGEFERFLDHPGRGYETAYGLKTHGPPEKKPGFLNLGFHFPPHSGSSSA
ncbi:sulfatase-like hydrolase/transferase [Luteolibacter algae]|uniref:Sulfatase-like hydrolase/transferase n=1 Tax=Luteolibacter algae TaxID=454151 RepID=A0ABW5D2H5_9BACT